MLGGLARTLVLPAWLLTHACYVSTTCIDTPSIILRLMRVLLAYRYAALPVRRYGPADGWEVLWGYAQEVAMGERAVGALVADIKAAEAAGWGSESGNKQ